MNNQLTAARAKVNSLEFGTPEWEVAMQVVRDLVAAEPAPKFDGTEQVILNRYSRSRVLRTRTVRI
jgi:hypothetical protein